MIGSERGLCWAFNYLTCKSVHDLENIHPMLLKKLQRIDELMVNSGAGYTDVPLVLVATIIEQFESDNPTMKALINKRE